MKGKLAYMAPEQVTAKDIDHRADIFALGCVLYEVTVGRRPFQGEGALSTLYQLLEQAVMSPVEASPGYPPELAAIVLKALAKDADERFQTSEDLRVALEGWIASTGSKANEREIAALLRATVGDEIDQKSRSINEAAAKLKETPSERPRRVTQLAAVVANLLGWPDVVRVRPPSIAGSPPAGVREKSTSWLLPVGAGLAVLGLVVVLAKGTLGSSAVPAPPDRHSRARGRDTDHQQRSAASARPRASRRRCGTCRSPCAPSRPTRASPSTRVSPCGPPTRCRRSRAAICARSRPARPTTPRDAPGHL